MEQWVTDLGACYFAKFSKKKLLLFLSARFTDVVEKLFLKHLVMLYDDVKTRHCRLFCNVLFISYYFFNMISSALIISSKVWESVD